MDPKYLLFNVDRPIGSGLLGGRNCSDEIEVGDVFTALYRRATAVDTEDADSTPFELVRLIALQVCRIESYGKDLAEIYTGYTCGLALSGDTSGIPEESFIGDHRTMDLWITRSLDAIQNRSDGDDQSPTRCEVDA